MGEWQRQCWGQHQRWLDVAIATDYAIRNGESSKPIFLPLNLLLERIAHLVLQALGILPLSLL